MSHGQEHLDLPPTLEERFRRYAKAQKLPREVGVALEAFLREAYRDALRYSGSLTDQQRNTLSDLSLSTIYSLNSELVDDNGAEFCLEDIPLPPRYRPMGLLGEGGMGVVLRVFDGVLNRPLAMKLIRQKSLAQPDSESLSRFLKEAQLTAQLQHPGIAPVHDLGRLEDGRFFFTLKEVSGDTLKRVIKGVHGASPMGAWGISAEGWSLRRLLEVFVRVCETVSYAHGQGVLHRDLKPSNIMVGAFGEVVVMDWGIAKITGEMGWNDAGQTGSSPADQTAMGSVAGTPAYMAPEQAMGAIDELGAHSDIYALGAILYTILCNRAPYEGQSAAEILHKVRHQDPRPLSREPVNARGDETLVDDTVTVFEASTEGGDISGSSHFEDFQVIPEVLKTLCAWAMAREPSERIPSAQVLADRLRDYLDGVARRDAALAVVDGAQKRRSEQGHLHDELSQLERQVRDAEHTIRPWDILDKKRPIWSLQDALSELKKDIRLEEVHYLQDLRSALNHDPNLVEAHNLLADYYADKLLDAERAQDAHSAECFAILLREHDRGKYHRLLDGKGALTLHLSHANAQIQVARYVEKERQMVLEPFGNMGGAPIHETWMEPGTYCLRITAPGRDRVDYPIHIERGAHWTGVAPDESAPRPIWLPPAGTLTEEERYIPAGWFQIGGDDKAPDGLPYHRAWAEGFIIRKFPVRVGEYLAFLNDIEAELARDYAPIETSRTGGTIRLNPNGRYEIVPTAEGGVWHAQLPVAQISWYGAFAYSQWFAAKTGKPWRLPHDWEWEKAARGVAGWLHPWGYHFEPRWARMNQSIRQDPCAVSVEDYPEDTSLYGVRGTGGNVREWCASGYLKRVSETKIRLMHGRDDLGDDLRMIRGGSWPDSPQFCRLAARFANKPAAQFSSLGFRLVYSIPQMGD